MTTTPGMSDMPVDGATVQPPRVLLVLGCTGVGKTQLGLELGRRFGGELVSCDSIQVYAGLPIASNQCTVHEAEGVRQHAMAVVAPWRAMHVHGFRKAAKALVSTTNSGRSRCRAGHSPRVTHSQFPYAPLTPRRSPISPAAVGTW
jgi:hypothetical protein